MTAVAAGVTVVRVEACTQARGGWWFWRLTLSCGHSSRRGRARRCFVCLGSWLRAATWQSAVIGHAERDVTAKDVILAVAAN